MKPGITVRFPRDHGAHPPFRTEWWYVTGWLRTADGEWHEVTTAKFTCDPTGKADRFDRFMGVENGQFFLSTGGFGPGFTPFGELFNRPATGKAPSDLALPPLPE